MPRPMTLWRPYTQMQTAPPAVEAVATRGVRIFVAGGGALIDGIASWWTACHGYNHPHIYAAVEQQLRAMPHVMLGGLTHKPAETLAARLVALLPGDLDHVFFSDSGSVAVEVALKMAVQFWINRGVAGRTKFVCFTHGYHGDTLGAMSVCDPVEGMHAPFRGWLPEQVVVPLPRTRDELAGFDRMLAARKDEIAGVIVEPLVQAAGGMRFHDAETLAAIRGAAARHDVLFIADEVATGFGRTGTMFACEQAAVTPDIVCLGKALTGGAMGMAATVATTRVFEAFLSDDPAKALMHGPTYMANPLSCAAANASLDLFEKEPRLGQVARIAAQMEGDLAACRGRPGVVDVRVLGAVGVVQMERIPDVEALRRRFIERRVFIRPFGDVIYLMPALLIAKDDLSALTGAIGEELS
ncbi:MAG: adenosylmethionine--8-amino-7-oxononanoate transaminase [Rhodospirillaceae bacterium]